MVCLLASSCNDINRQEHSYDKELYCQLFLGKWKVTDIAPVEIATPSVYSGFDENNHFRGQDLIDNIVGQELFFGEDYIENRGIKYKLASAYKTYSVALSEDMIIGCTTAKSLGIVGNYVSVVYFSIRAAKKEAGQRDFTNLNQLYLKDSETIYASVNGYLTFQLERENP